MLRICILILGIGFAYPLVAQDSKPTRARISRGKTNAETPTTLQPYFPPENFSAEKKGSERKRKEQAITYNAREKFYERMEEVARQRRKNEKMMAKPQYSDPMYFGHKRPPKKRSPEKMKYCKICGIRH